MDYRQANTQVGFSNPPYMPLQENLGHTQSQQQQQTVVVVQQPTSTMNTGGQPQNIRDWSTGLCDCCDDCGICATALFCPPCYMCWLAHDMGESMCGAFWCGGAFAIPMRTKVRTMYGIRGDICSDVNIMCCCSLCALTQTHRELKYSGFTNF